MVEPEAPVDYRSTSLTLQVNTNKAWGLGEEEVLKFSLNIGDNKPCRCEQHF